jgi:hypothetical protein
VVASVFSQAASAGGSPFHSIRLVSLDAADVALYFKNIIPDRERTGIF